MTGRLVVGLGLRADTTEADILACLDEALAIAGLSGEATPRLATLASRIGEPGLAAAAVSRAAEVVGVPDEALKGFEAAARRARRGSPRSTASARWRKPPRWRPPGRAERWCSRASPPPASPARWRGHHHEARGMTIHFIGAGPGAPDLITLRGRDLIASCRSASMRAR